MIAEVYPLKRFPRSMTVFDYKVPVGLEVLRGDLVKVPLRNKEEWAIVKKVKMKPERGIRLKELIEVYKTDSLREEELSFFEWLASDLAQSVCSILNVSIPTPPKRSRDEIPEKSQQSNPITLPRIEIDSLTRVVLALHAQRECIVQIPDLRRMASVIAAYITSEPDKKIVVIAPTINQVKLLATHLSDYDPIIITGEEKNNTRYQRFKKLRNSKKAFLIGTKVAALLVDTSITTYFVVNSSDMSHKQPDRNPRFDVRDILWNIHDRIQANLFFFDPCPRIVDQAKFPESGRHIWGNSPHTHIIDMRVERQGSSNFALSSLVENEISNSVSSGGRVLCVLNRKGVSAGIVCKSCSARVVCRQCSSPLRAVELAMKCVQCNQITPATLRCASCGSSDLNHVALGIEGFADILRNLIHESVVKTYSKEESQINDSNVIICTNYFLDNEYDPFSKNVFDLVVVVDADAPLYSPGLNAKERALEQILQWRSVAGAYRGKFMIQTSYPTLFSQLLSDQEGFFKDELEQRMRYKMPPYVRVVTILNKDIEKRRAELEMHALIQKIKSCTNSTISRPELTDNNLSIRVYVNHDEYENLAKIFTELPDRYIIDTYVNV